MIPEKCVVLTPAITCWYVDKFFEKFGVENKVLIEYSDFTNLISVVAHAITMENLVIITDHLTPQKMLIQAAYACGKVGVNFITASPNHNFFIVKNYETGEHSIA